MASKSSGELGAPPAVERTRLAPSPTGALHPGNARTFLVNWALARQGGWRILLRIEDLDGPRVKPGAIDETIRLLEWLGLDWDEGPVVQSRDTAAHGAAMQRLAEEALAYPCALTRREIAQAASAPQEGANETRVPSALRPPLAPRRFDDPGANWRFATPAGAVEFVDRLCGPQRRSPSESAGDFVIWTKRGQAAYQLAVVADDHRQGVTQVVRGDDLLDSAARQLLLYKALDFAPAPTYTHLPLVVGPDGRRLAKRHGDSRLSRYREQGVAPERVVGLSAWWSGVGDRADGPEAMSAVELADRFDLSLLPRVPAVFTAEDEAWLFGET